MSGKCAWCGDEIEAASCEEWSAYEAMLSGDPALARLTLWLTPGGFNQRSEIEPIILELHPGLCYTTARDALRRAVFPTRIELCPDRRRAVMPHGWWHMLERAQKKDRSANG